MLGAGPEVCVRILNPIFGSTLSKIVQGWWSRVEEGFQKVIKLKNVEGAELIFRATCLVGRGGEETRLRQCQLEKGNTTLECQSWTRPGRSAGVGV